MGYTIDSRNPVWMPAIAGGTGTRSDDSIPTSSNPSYVTETHAPDGTASPTASLQDIRSAIAWLAGGSGIAGYADCITFSLRSERMSRDRVAYRNGWSPGIFEFEVAAGAAAGALLHRYTYHDSWDETDYTIRWLAGDDPDLFTPQVVDDDNQSDTGYFFDVVTVRPLPAGTYQFLGHVQSPEYIPCNFIPSQTVLDWRVTVIALDGTVHEALFDPGTIGAGAGYSSTVGNLDPANFTLGSSDISITGLKHESGSVVMALSPYNALAGHTLDFIAEDGSTSLSLTAGDATGDSAADTLTWRITGSPWSSEDKMMLRITAPQAP